MPARAEPPAHLARRLGADGPARDDIHQAEPEEDFERIAPAAQVARGSSSYMRIYLGIWAILAAGALGYLTLLTMQPELIASLLRLPADGETEGGQTQRNLSKAMTELRTVNKSLGELQKEFMQVRAAVTVLEDRDRAIMARLAAVEEKPGASGSTASISSRTTENKLGARTLQGATVQGYVDEATTPGRSEAAGQQLAANAPKTPDAPKAPDAAPLVIGPAVVTSAKAVSGQTVSIQIGSGPSVDSIRLTWSLLLERHKAQLRRLEPRVMAGRTPTEAPFQLLAGPLASEQEAQKICQALKGKRVECAIVPGVLGDAL